ncbi:MAG TPA: hypothetical protein VKA15_12580 [Isosphaeraceae bacterium]|nr:hypothetical protein [Isosphaeraceae bacterium]
MAENPLETLSAGRIPSSAVVPTNGLSSAPAMPEEGDDAERERLRGIVALPHKRDVLFTDEVELDVEKLPRWQPHISVDERRLTDDDHE